MSEHVQCKAIFQKIYGEKKGLPYVWSAKDGANLKQLINKLKYVGSVDIEADMQLFVSKAWELGDNWQKEHFSVAILNSQFNEIFSKIRSNGRANNVSTSYAEQLLRDLHS